MRERHRNPRLPRLEPRQLDHFAVDRLVLLLRRVCLVQILFNNAGRISFHFLLFDNLAVLGCCRELLIVLLDHASDLCAESPKPGIVVVGPFQLLFSTQSLR
jgi:hypothetical protein